MMGHRDGWDTVTDGILCMMGHLAQEAAQLVRSGLHQSAGTYSIGAA